MKLKSLILGSVAAAGLSTAGFAADLGVLTSLDVCDALGLSGLTISSETNCLQISGGVSYEFRYGDYRTGPNGTGGPNIGFVPAIGTESNNIDIIADGGFGDADMDYESKVEAWLKFVGTADSDFGPASATIRLKSVEKTRYTNEGSDTIINVDGDTAGGISFPDDTNGIIIDEAYVSIGDQTVIMAGKKSSIAEFGDAQPFNFLGTWGYGEVDTGVLFQDDEDEPFTGGQVIQVTSDLGNGVNVSVGLENLQGVSLVDDNGDDDKIADSGTLIGVVAYAGEGITAHLTGIAIGVLDGEIDDYGVHAGATGTFDLFKVRGAVGYLQYDDGSALNDGLEGSDLHALLSGAATFDLFTVALTGEYTRAEDEGSVDDGFGVGGSVGAAVTDGVSINLGARYFTADFDGNGTTTGDNFDSDILQVAAQVVAELTETIKATGELGVYFTEGFETDDEVYYGSAQLAWAPGGGFTSAVIGEVNSEGGYRATFRAAKTFE